LLRSLLTWDRLDFSSFAAFLFTLIWLSCFTELRNSATSAQTMLLAWADPGDVAAGALAGALLLDVELPLDPQPTRRQHTAAMIISQPSLGIVASATRSHPRLHSSHVATARI